ncbi:MAG: radical SAM protein [Prevotellaceae bacterium]|nr:radical SAM protein [Prevotellaceae bacterium]
MKKINEIFYSLQGEGYNTGRPALFIRFSVCNLRCSFCDTDFSHYEEMQDADIVKRALDIVNAKKAEGQSNDTAMPMIVLTGGEPSLQADVHLIDALHAAGFTFIAMESNGTHEPPRGIDWLTISPKEHTLVNHCSELKVLFDDVQPVSTHGISADHYFLQPLDTGDTAKNKTILTHCFNYLLEHPQWRMSLQTHKLMGIR